MKKKIALLLIITIISSFCPMPNHFIMTASAANQTYFYGFEDNALPSEMSLTYCESYSFSNGIMSITPQNDDPGITLNKTFSADEVNQIKIRMYHNLTTRSDGKDLYQIQVYYMGTDASGAYLSGSTNKLTEGNSVKKSIELSSDGKYITYTLDFSTESNWAGSTINRLRIDPVSSNSVEGDTVKIDYIMLCKKADEIDPIISYEFDEAGDYMGFVPLSTLKSYTNVADGCLNYSNSGNVSADISYALPGLSVETKTYEYIEVIMAHDISASGETSDLLKIYIEATLADGTINTISKDPDTIRCTLTATSNGQFQRYLFPLTELYDGTSLLGATITKIRIDPINYYGSASIDSIRFVPHYVVYEPVDPEKTTLSYTFENSEAGCAKGTIKLDFGEQNPLLAKNVELMWASGNATDGYTPLEGYSSITTKTGSEMAKGYVISKPLYIPEGTTALIARVSHSGTTFDKVVAIPDSKVLAKTEPKFTAALASDFHFGDSSKALRTPAQKYYDLQNHVQANADTLLVAGDFVQWYGVRDRNEYYHLEYLAGDTNYSDYAEYDPTALPSQWDMAMDYFQSWDIPVFVVEGNHETPSGSRITKGHTGKYMKDWMTEWVNYTNNSSMYDNFVERDKHIYENTYEYSTNYDGYVKADDGTRYHVITMRNLHMGSNKLTAKELDWLDKKLYESEADGTPAFVIMHVPLKSTVIPDDTKHSNDFNDPNFKAIIEKHPNTIIASGHTHYSLYSDWQWTINGAGNSPSYVHVGGVIGTENYYPDTNTNDSENKDRCELVYAEVYEDRIVTRAYDVAKGQYIATSVNQITLKPETTIEDISVSRVISEDSVTLTASSKTSGLSYQWYVGGEAVAAGASVTVDAKCGEFVAVRATDATGSFRSESFDSVYDEAIADEERTYFVSMSDSDGYNATWGNDFKQTTFVEWANAAGKSDNVMKITYTSESETNRTYIRNTWTKQNPDSKYLVIKYNAMPLDDHTTVYFCTSSSSTLTARYMITPFEWSNVTAVITLDSSSKFPVTTYINGKKVADSTSNKFGNNSDPAKNGILRLALATSEDSLKYTSMAAYIDELEIYETVNAPVIAPVCDMVQPEVNGTNAYSAENKLAYVPAGTTTKALSQAFWCVVVDANGATKASDEKVADTDRLMYHDPVTGSYNYYSVKTYTDYESLFIEGVADKAFTASDVKLYVNAKTAGDTVVIAQYDGEDDLVTAQYKVCEAAGLNEITFTKDDDTSYATVFVWDSITNIKPLVDVLDILVK